MHLRSLLLISALGSTLGGCTCGPTLREPPPEDAAERYADAVCSAHERCGCMGQGFSSVSECREQSIAKFGEIAGWSGVQFDLDCFEDVLEHFQGGDCGGLSETTALSCETFTGTLRQGESCNASDWIVGRGGALTSGPCADGSPCVFGVCARHPAPQVGAGEPCHLTLGVGCGGNDHYCSRQGVCTPGVASGEACSSPLACPAGQYCAGLPRGEDGPGECREKVPTGGSCDPKDTNPCRTSGEGFCSVDGICVEEAWPGLCHLVHPAPNEYDATYWVPL